MQRIRVHILTEESEKDFANATESPARFILNGMAEKFVKEF